MKNMYSLPSYLLLLITITAIATPTITSVTTVGVTYSYSASISGTVQLSPDIIAVKVVSLTIPATRLLDLNTAYPAFNYTNVSLFLSVPNPLVHLLASNHSHEIRWVYHHVLPFHPCTKISIISVGIDVGSYPFILPVMRSAHQSLMDVRVYTISVSATFSFFNIIPTAFPHSSAQFQQPNGEMIIRTILRFLDYLHGGVRNRNLVDGVRNRNLFDVKVDAVIRVMAFMGHDYLPVIVAETGWPSFGIDASDATLMYSELYLKALLTHLISGSGTPLRKEGASEIYIFELVVKHEKQGIRNWGVVHRNMTN